MLSRWLRASERANEYVYVTLGGTELRDIQCLKFIDPALVSKVVSYEEDNERFKVAIQRAAALRGEGLDIEVVHGDFFSYKRRSALPHIFFLDLIGICAWGDYASAFGELFQNEVVREGDLLMITSHLGHNLGMPKIQSTFSGEFSVLGIHEAREARQAYRCAHPSFTLFRALNARALDSELRVKCLGCIKYRDNSPMGLYGFSIEPGTTELKLLVRDAGILYFDMNEVRVCPEEEF
jgi:hypothetical protein